MSEATLKLNAEARRRVEEYLWALESVDDDERETMTAADLRVLVDCHDRYASARAAGAEEREKEIVAFARQFPTTILQFWDRPGGPPGNGYRPTTPADLAAALLRKEHLKGEG